MLARGFERWIPSLCTARALAAEAAAGDSATLWTPGGLLGPPPLPLVSPGLKEWLRLDGAGLGDDSIIWSGLWRLFSTSALLKTFREGVPR